jgi:hypothetical protein
MAKAVLGAMHRVLPGRVYDAFYQPAYDAYRRMLRASYRRHVERLRRDGDLDAVLRGELVHLVMPYSMVGPGGLERTYDVATYAVQRGLEGAFVECGVARGGSAALLACIAAREGGDRHCWFFDSYEGLPDPTPDDFDHAGKATGDHVQPLPKGACLGTYDEVHALLFARLHLDENRVTMVKGWFQDTLPPRRAAVGPITVLRLDGDWYESTMCCLENLFAQVVPGGHVIIDDYYTCHGSKKATDEYLGRLGLAPALRPDGRGGCSFQIPQR